MRAADGVTFSNIAATTAAFHLEGGRYAFLATATFGGGSVELQMLGPDGTTYVSLIEAFLDPAAGTAAEKDLNIGTLKAAGMKVVDLPPGIYKIAITTATAVYTGVYRIPGE